MAEEQPECEADICIDTSAYLLGQYGNAPDVRERINLEEKNCQRTDCDAKVKVVEGSLIIQGICAARR